MKCVTGWSPRSCSLWQWGRNRGPRWGTHRPGLLAIGVLEAAPVKHPGGTSLPCFLLELQREVPWPPVSTFAPSVPFFFIAFSKLGGWGGGGPSSHRCRRLQLRIRSPAPGGFWAVRGLAAAPLLLLLPLHRERGGPHHSSGPLQLCRLMILNTFTAAFTTRVEEPEEMGGGNQDSSDPGNGQASLSLLGTGAVSPVPEAA